MNKSNKISKQEAIFELWRRGELGYLLDKNQKELRDLFYKSNEKISVWLLSRRAGKSTTLISLATELCLKNPKTIVKYLCPTKSQAKLVLRPLVEKQLEHCPKDLKPELKESDYIYYFPNGSELQMAGADSGHAEKLRGQDAHAVFVDEAGSVDNLKYIIQSILIPTTLITKGKIVLASTPPVESEHDFLWYIEEADKNKMLIKKTIYDIPRLTPQDIEDAKKEMGGEHTNAFRREYLCEIMKDENSSVIPEFDDALAKEIVRTHPRPTHFDSYVAMDLGFKDLTALVFGYYDFKNAKIIIEDELILDFQQPDMNLSKATEMIGKKEEELWMNVYTNEIKRPHLRVSDIDYIVLGEIYRASGNKISFAPALKFDKEANINNLRTLLASRKVIINPKCTNLIRHLKNVKWNKTKTSFARSSENGHYDLVDALLYLVRHVSFTKNPYPADYNLDRKSIFVWDQGQQKTSGSNVDMYKRMFNVGKKYGR